MTRAKQIVKKFPKVFFLGLIVWILVFYSFQILGNFFALIFNHTHILIESYGSEVSVPSILSDLKNAFSPIYQLIDVVQHPSALLNMSTMNFISHALWITITVIIVNSFSESRNLTKKEEI